MAQTYSVETQSNEAFVRFFRKAAELRSAATGWVAFLAPPLTRLVVGQTFFLTGRGKLMNFDRTVDFFTSLGLPFPAVNAGLVAGLETIGGICLMLGLMTRFFSTGLAISMTVALLTADRQNFVDALPGDLTNVAPVPLLLFLTWMIGYGPGLISLDRLVTKFILGRFWKHGRSARTAVESGSAQAFGDSR